MSNDCAICYVADLNFLLPTFVSAASVRKFVTPKKADIFIFVVDGNEKDLQKFDGVLKPQGIHILPMDSGSFGDFDEKGWNVTHVSKSTLGRFFINDLLPDRYTRILYLDGDTLVVRDPSPLIDFAIPEGKFAAVEDKQWFSRYDLTGGKTVRDYFGKLGVTSGYFNGGMFLVDRATWAIIAREAYQFFKNNIEQCRYHDQSAVNAVVGDRRLHLSLAWNFQTPYRMWGFERDITPAIYHFVGPLKPWLGPLQPWAEYYSLYEKMAVQFNVSTKKYSTEEVIDANKRVDIERIKLTYFYPIRALLKRRRARRMQAHSVLNV